MSKIKVLMVGPSPQVMGGISAVVQTYIASDLPNRIDLKYLSTHVDGNKFIKFLMAIQAYLRLPIIFFVFKPDIVHIHLASYFSFYRKLTIFSMAKWFKKKIIIHLHGGNFLYFYSSNKVNAFLIKKVFHEADAIIAVSDSWGKKINSHIGGKKIFVLYNPVDTSLYEDLMPWERGSAIKKILFMAVVNNNKGAYDIIKLIPDITALYPNTQFIFAGNGDIEKAKRLCRVVGVLDKVEFPGWVGADAKKIYYSEACIYLLPSHSEGLPLSVLEAMAAGLPVITTRVGGIPDIIEDSVNGYLVQPGDVETMKEKLSLLLSRQDIREKFGRVNKLKAQNNFDIELIAGQLFEMYRTVYSNDNKA